jgi:hypothetical protein
MQVLPPHPKDKFWTDYNQLVACYRRRDLSWFTRILSIIKRYPGKRDVVMRHVSGALMSSDFSSYIHLSQADPELFMADLASFDQTIAIEAYLLFGIGLDLPCYVKYKKSDYLRLPSSRKYLYHCARHREMAAKNRRRAAYWHAHKALRLSVNSPGWREIFTWVHKYKELAFVETSSSLRLERGALEIQPLKVINAPSGMFALPMRAGMNRREDIILDEAADMVLVKQSGFTGYFIKKYSLRDLTSEWSPHLASFGPITAFHEALDHLPEGDDVDEPSIVLSSYYGVSNYSHILLDPVPRLLFIKNNYPEYSSCQIIIDAQAPSIVERVLEIVAPGQRTKRLSDSRKHCLKRAVFCSSLAHPAHHADPFIIHFFRSLSSIYSWKSADLFSAIFIDRPKGRRGAHNAAELDCLLVKYGIQRVDLSSMSFPEQIQLFRAAKLIIGAHGAGLANIVFCPPTAKIIEVFPANYGIPSFGLLAQGLGLDYYATADYRHGDNVKPSDPTKKFEDVCFPVLALDQLIAKLGVCRP